MSEMNEIFQMMVIKNIPSRCSKDVKSLVPEAVEEKQYVNIQGKNFPAFWAVYLAVYEEPWSRLSGTITRSGYHRYELLRDIEYRTIEEDDIDGFSVHDPKNHRKDYSRLYLSSHHKALNEIDAKDYFDRIVALIRLKQLHLLKDYGVDLCRKSDNGDNLLYHRLSDTVENYDYLLSIGIDPKSKNKIGLNAIDVTTEENLIEAVKNRKIFSDEELETSLQIAGTHELFRDDKIDFWKTHLKQTEDNKTIFPLLGIAVDLEVPDRFFLAKTAIELYEKYTGKYPLSYLNRLLSFPLSTWSSVGSISRQSFIQLSEYLLEGLQRSKGTERISEEDWKKFIKDSKKLLEFDFFEVSWVAAYKMIFFCDLYLRGLEQPSCDLLEFKIRRISTFELSLSDYDDNFQLFVTIVEKLMKLEKLCKPRDYPDSFCTRNAVIFRVKDFGISMLASLLSRGMMNHRTFIVAEILYHIPFMFDQKSTTDILKDHGYAKKNSREVPSLRLLAAQSAKFTDSQRRKLPIQLQPYFSRN